MAKHSRAIGIKSAAEVPIWITQVIPFLNIEPACRQAGVEQGTLNSEVS